MIDNKSSRINYTKFYKPSGKRLLPEYLDFYNNREERPRIPYASFYNNQVNAQSKTTSCTLKCQVK